jgi:hypothetical protein
MKSHFLIVVSALSLANIDTIVEVALNAALQESTPQPSQQILISKAPIKKALDRS